MNPTHSNPEQLDYTAVAEQSVEDITTEYIFPESTVREQFKETEQTEKEIEVLSPSISEGDVPNPEDYQEFTSKSGLSLVERPDGILDLQENGVFKGEQNEKGKGVFDFGGFYTAVSKLTSPEKTEARSVWKSNSENSYSLIVFYKDTEGSVTVTSYNWEKPVAEKEGGAEDTNEEEQQVENPNPEILITNSVASEVEEVAVQGEPVSPASVQNAITRFQESLADTDEPAATAEALAKDIVERIQEAENVDTKVLHAEPVEDTKIFAPATENFVEKTDFKNSDVAISVEKVVLANEQSTKRTEKAIESLGEEPFASEIATAELLTSRLESIDIVTKDNIPAKIEATDSSITDENISLAVLTPVSSQSFSNESVLRSEVVSPTEMQPTPKEAIESFEVEVVINIPAQIEQIEQDGISGIELSETEKLLGISAQDQRKIEQENTQSSEAIVTSVIESFDEPFLAVESNFEARTQQVESGQTTPDAQAESKPVQAARGPELKVDIAPVEPTPPTEPQTPDADSHEVKEVLTVLEKTFTQENSESLANFGIGIAVRENEQRFEMSKAPVITAAVAVTETPHFETMQISGIRLVQKAEQQSRARSSVIPTTNNAEEVSLPEQVPITLAA